MLKRYFEKIWVQNTALLLMLGLISYYFTFVFEFRTDLNWSILITETEYGHMGKLLLNGLGLTITISIYSAILAILLGTLFGLARLSKFKPVYGFATVYVEFFRNTPLLVQLFFWNFALPNAFSEEIRMKLFELNFEFWAATIGLGIFTSAFMAEIIRAGIQSIPKGLLEASYSSGMTFGQTLRRIILPLAFREIIPPLGSEFLNNMKNSSLAMTLGVAELCWSMNEVEALTYAGFEATAVATVTYLVLSLIIAAFLNLVNMKLKIIGKGQEPLTRRIADALFWPVGAVWETVSRTFRRLTRPKASSKTLTPFQEFMHTAKSMIWKGTVLGSKVIFVLFLAWLAYRTIMGVASFNFTIIADNMRALLIWRFPKGGSTEVFFGLGGLAMSIVMAVFSISVSFFIGLFVGMGRTSKNRAIKVPCTLYIELIRGNPLIIVIFWMYFFFPVIFGIDLDVFWSATWAMTIFFGAYIAEIVRGGIENIPPGQTEAAKSTGLSYLQTMRKVVLPQALKQMLPAIVGMFIAAFKDTSLAYIIGVPELTTAAYSINNRLMLYPFEIYTTIAVMYFVCCYLMSLYSKYLEHKLSPEKVRLEM
ncbi:amino acid ABC transporter permease [Pseudodesulfovibrio tunisiensis]|uniref:amino acid ABC transporter permease n=1 Tax=Pseudodesulfovibrio tunisiensis TaxID=463192 RepID=UPI001FB3B08B|nr:amino acid ABC transporter permease [Pseudodesulfovibrio tunisiensis]